MERAGSRAARPRWSVGVDLGGTWLRVLAVDDRGRRRTHRRRAVGLGELRESLESQWRRWRVRPADIGALLVASRGVWTPAERNAAARRLESLARRVRVISDVEAAYHATLGRHPGVLILAGTGSIALGRGPRGRWVRAGGLGPLLGDPGSAFWIGREWLRATAGSTGLAARRLATVPDGAARVAALAPAVLARARRGHREARRIVAGAQDELASLILAVGRRLRVSRPVPVGWGGSLLAAEGFRAGVWRAARRMGLHPRPCPPRVSAVGAAAELASGLLGPGLRRGRHHGVPSSGGTGRSGRLTRMR